MSVPAFAFTDRAYPVVEIGIGDVRDAVGAVWDVDVWDTGVWAGIEPQWFDVSCHTQSIRVSYGRVATSDRFAVGVATITVDNTTGWADPDTTDPAGVLSIRPGRQIRVSVVHAVHGVRVLFRGYIDAMIPVYSPQNADAVLFDCVDAMGEVNRAKLVGTTPVGAGEAASTRAHRILDAVDWGTRDIWPASTALVATELDGQVADLLGVTADSAGGAVFGDMAGRVAFRGRDWQSYVPSTPVDGTIGNVDPDDVCPVQWERPFNRADITTRVIIGRGDVETDPYVKVLDDPDGIAKYGIEPFERTDLLTASSQVVDILAERVLATRGDDTAPRVRSVTLDARTSDAALDLMATVDVYHPSRYRCRLQYPPPRGDVFDGEYFATAVDHDITRDRWTLLLNLDVAAPFAAAGARWDQAFWDMSTWADAVTQQQELV